MTEWMDNVEMAIAKVPPFSDRDTDKDTEYHVDDNDGNIKRPLQGNLHPLLLTKTIQWAKSIICLSLKDDVIIMVTDMTMMMMMMKRNARCALAKFTPSDDVMITNMMMMKITKMMMMIIRYARAKFTPPLSSKERKTTSSLFARTWNAPKQKGQMMI